MILSHDWFQARERQNAKQRQDKSTYANVTDNKDPYT